MTIQIPRRGKQYLETVQTLLRVAKTMVDQSVALQLKVHAADYQRRAVEASHADAAEASASFGSFNIGDLLHQLPLVRRLPHLSTWGGG